MLSYSFLRQRLLTLRVSRRRLARNLQKPEPQLPQGACIPTPKAVGFTRLLGGLVA